MLFLLFLAALYSFITQGIVGFALVFGALPIMAIVLAMAFSNQMFTFWVLFTINYLVFFLGRMGYMGGIPTSLPTEALEMLLIALAVIDAGIMRFEKIANAMLLAMPAMAQTKSDETPMMRQFYSLKEKHPDAVLLFRCGDFYETYAQDAVEASQILGITLTRRNNGKNGAAALEMAGFPHHALDAYLPKLIRAGRRVAICDQLEDPKLTKTLVKRGITELVTPGVAMSDNVLQNKENNFLAAVHFGKGALGLSFLDISTGEYLVAEGPSDHIDKLLANFGPKEVLIERGRRQQFCQSFGTKYCMRELDDWVFTQDFAREKLNRHFHVRNLKGFGVDHLQNGKVAAGAILEYLA